MANQTRKRSNFITGTIDNDPLSNSGTTLISDELIALPAVDASEHMAIVLDPTGAGNGPEVVWVTAHTAGVSTATIVRAREGSSAVQHTSVRTWVHAPTAADFTPFLCTSATRPSAGGLPYQGMTIYETDTLETLEYNGVNWHRPWELPWGVIGYASATADQTAISSIVDLTSLTITFTAVANRRYRVVGDVQCAARANGNTVTLFLADGSNTIINQRGETAENGYSFGLHVEREITPAAGSTTYKLRLNSSTGTADLLAAATKPAELVIIDIGPNGTAT